MTITSYRPLCRVLLWFDIHAQRLRFYSDCSLNVTQRIRLQTTDTAMKSVILLKRVLFVVSGSCKFAGVDLLVNLIPGSLPTSSRSTSRFISCAYSSKPSLRMPFALSRTSPEGAVWRNRHFSLLFSGVGEYHQCQLFRCCHLCPVLFQNIFYLLLVAQLIVFLQISIQVSERLSRVSPHRSDIRHFNATGISFWNSLNEYEQCLPVYFFIAPQNISIQLNSGWNLGYKWYSLQHWWLLLPAIPFVRENLAGKLKDRELLQGWGPRWVRGSFQLGFDELLFEFSHPLSAECCFRMHILALPSISI
jgi:hypothetical protein